MDLLQNKNRKKPVELLYKSLEDVKREVGRKDAQSTYQELEKERQKKLEACRKIRNELLMQGYPYCSPSSSLKNHLGNRSSTSEPPNAEIRPSPEASEKGNHDIFKSGEHVCEDFQVLNTTHTQSPFTYKINLDLQTLNITERNGEQIEVSESVKSPLVVQSEVIPIGLTDAGGSSKSPEQVDLSPLPSLTKSNTNSNAFEERKVKSAEQRTFGSRPSSSGGRHKRSQSLPLRPDTPKGIHYDFKSEPYTIFILRIRIPNKRLRDDKNVLRTGSSMASQGRKSSLGILDSGKNLAENPGSPESFELPSIDKKQENHVYFEDINNNHSKAPVIMRPMSSRRKKHLERRKLLECKKVFDQIRAQYKDPEYCLLKYKQIIDNSIERELREQEVRKVQRRIEEGFEMWQDKVLMLQWLDSERAEEQVTRNLSTKMEKIRQTQKNKEIVHAINLNKVKEEDDIRAEILRRELKKKERKIQILQEEKERVIHESKSRALAVSELKEQIRNIMTPETFDQKVSKCGREKKVIRVLHPPARCPAIMQQSHICLG